MATRYTQGLYTEQTQTQMLRLSPTQMLTAKLLELPITSLEERVKNELIDNIALEEGKSNGNDNDNVNDNDNDTLRYDNDDGNDNDNGNVNDDVNDDDTLRYDNDNDDELPVHSQASNENRTEMPIGDSVSFIDDLRTQLLDLDLSELQFRLVDYLICSLDDNGFIESDLNRIADDLAFNEYLDVTTDELQEALHTLQSFDPAGIGARNNQECLLLQIDRRMQTAEDGEKIALQLQRDIIADHYDLFVVNNTERLAAELGITTSKLKRAFEGLRKLNLHPGLSLCESASDRIQTLVPDFFIETDPEGGITFQLNKGDIRPLRISSEYQLQLQQYQQEAKTSRSAREAADFTRHNIDAAQTFVNAINMRHQTMRQTMRAIIQLQRNFILTQDADELNKMVLQDVAQLAKLDISTISRVCNSKYTAIDGNIYPLSFFFKHFKQNANGEDIDQEKVESAIREAISKEDKSNPLTDEQLANALKAQGINLSRRTTAKYRDAAGIPIAKKRQT